MFFPSPSFPWCLPPNWKILPWIDGDQNILKKPSFYLKKSFNKSSESIAKLEHLPRTTSTIENKSKVSHEWGAATTSQGLFRPLWGHVVFQVAKAENSLPVEKEEGDWARMVSGEISISNFTFNFFRRAMLIWQCRQHCRLTVCTTKHLWSTSTCGCHSITHISVCQNFVARCASVSCPR